MNKTQGLVGNVGAALRRSLGVLRTVCVAALLLPALSVMAQTQSTTTLSASPNPSTYGQSVVLTATVVGNAPAGTVTFKDGATTLGTATLSAGVASLTRSTLTAGSHSLTAVYGGDTNNTGSTSAALTQTVNKFPTSADSFTITPSSVTLGQNVTFTASMTGVNPTGTATATMTLAGNPQGPTVYTAPLPGTGNTRTATYTTNTLAAGNYTFSLAYSGDTNNAAVGTGNVSLTVNKAPTSTALNSSLNPSNYGQSATLTATVSGGSNPGGTVTFMDGGTTLGTATISAGVASFATSSLSSGSHSLTAVYAGDTNNNPSTSSVLTQTVNTVATATTTSLASSANPSTFGQSVTLTASVAGNAPSGAVTFMDGTTTLGTGSISAGVATFVTSAFTVGSHSLTAVYAGDASNLTSTSSAMAQAVNAAATTTALTSSANPSNFGQSVTLTATVTGQSPGGTVTFMDGATTLGTGTINAGVATLATSALSVASHSITAVYGGDINNAGSTSTAVAQVVNQAVSSTTLASSANPATFGTSITLTATVAGNSPSGSVTFMDGATTLGTGTVSTGVATFVAPGLSVGSHSLTAVYGGDTNNASSASLALAQTVNAAATTTTLASSANPATFGQSVTLSATVTGNAPSGTVTFMDGATTLGTGTLSAGVASFTSSTLSVASHSITAVYGGDSNNAGSTSSAVAQVVNQASSTTTLASSANPSTFGQSITLTATVAGNAPTGIVTFMDGATTLGTGTLSAGVATFATSTLSVASHSITAVYGGDSNNAGSTSSAVALVVNQATTTTALTSSSNPATFAQSITLTATVTGQTPTGTVTFMDGATTLGTGTITAGVASFATSALSVASHNIMAVYGGDSNNAGSTSTAVAQVVNQAASTTTLTSSANPSTLGTSITLTATVTGQSPGGTVTFMDGATTLGTGTVSAGVANFTTSTLSVASHNLTAVYGGDVNNAGSNSAAVAQVVNQATSTTTLASSANPSTFGASITLTATVTGQTPSGTVTFMDGVTTLGIGTLSAGVATFSSSALLGGPHSLTAVYGGDTNNAASTSPAVSQSVTKLTTSTALSSNLNPANVGQSITLSASVTGGVTPSGSVTFKDGATTLGSGTITAGVASLNTTKLTGGSHNLSAVYGGDSNNAASTSAAVVQDVTLAASSTTLSATPNPASLGQNVTLTARLTGYNPSGTVTFLDGGTTLGTASVSGGVATLSLNSLGQGGHSLSAAYSGDGNNMGSISGAVSVSINARAGMTWQYGYDAMGRLNTVVDPNALASYIYYDSLGRAIQTQQPPNTGSATPTVIGMSYNLADGLTGVADPRNLVTSYSPNGLGRVTAQTSPDTGASQYSFDAKGNRLTSLDARGKTTSYAYDALDRLTAISYPTGTPTTLEYDGGASPTPAEKGELTKMSDESGQTSYSHDALGRLSTKTTVINGKSFTTSYAWGDSGSALDKLTAITYPSGSKVNYSFDAQGYLTAISVNPVNANGVGTGTLTSPLLSALGYNAENKLSGWLWADGKARTIAYDSVGMVSSYTLGDPLGSGAAAGALRSVNRDAAGRITGYSHVNNGLAVTGQDQSFGYDNLNRLLSASLAGSGISTLYSYDETGNRTSKTVGASTYSNTVSPTSNRLTQTQDVLGTATIQYDAAGHITSDGANSFTYTDRGRMSSAVTVGGTVNYLYNGLNQRVGKSGPTAVVPTGAAYYVYDEAGQLLGEYDAAGAPIYETIYLGSLPVGVMKQTGSAAGSDIAVNLYNLHADHIATPRVITRQDETIVWRWDTAEAFGGTAPEQDPSGLGAFTFNQRFPGQVFDSETGLFQNWNREYNARQGRYIQSDPIGLDGGINTFAYVEGDPLTGIDPRGLDNPSMGYYGDAYRDPYSPYGLPAPKYNARPPRTVPTTAQNEIRSMCIASCLTRPDEVCPQVVITGGSEGQPYHQGPAHPQTRAVDYGLGSNSWLRGKDPAKVMACARQCGFDHGWFENWGDPHWHFQKGSGGNVPPLPQ